ncbi:hypothetical protein B0H13DRAFT_1866543 [Mycena leptocephala]|nr:hypothetical protein B0H13DRAFT_1866543 [Mycena leptocephala]
MEIKEPDEGNPPEDAPRAEECRSNMLDEEKGRRVRGNAPFHSLAQKHRAYTRVSKCCNQCASVIVDPSILGSEFFAPVSAVHSKRAGGVGREKRWYGERSAVESAESGDLHGTFDDGCTYGWLTIESHGAFRGYRWEKRKRGSGGDTTASIGPMLQFNFSLTSAREQGSGPSLQVGAKFHRTEAHQGKEGFIPRYQG